MNCDVKSKGSNRVVYEIIHKSWVVFNGECEGDVDFLVWPILVSLLRLQLSRILLTKEVGADMSLNFQSP